MNKSTESKKALITGINGQDGSYLAEFLLSKGYVVHGMIRRSSVINTERIHHLYTDKDVMNKSLFLHYGDVTDTSNLTHLIRKIKPLEIYNLAAQSHVKVSFEIPEVTANVDAIGPLRILETIRNLGLENSIKLYQASTSELFGLVNDRKIKQNEKTSFYPRSPYSVAKLYGYWIVKNYRESYGMFCSNGILFNHESERRSFNFVSRKITLGLAKVKCGISPFLELGNIDSKRDWGYAKEYVESMWLMLQRKEPKDYVIATGKVYSVRDFAENSAKLLGFDIEWRGKGVSEIGVDKKTDKTIIKINPKYFRPAEVDYLCGDSSLAKKELGWEAKTDFFELVKIMTKHDYDLITRGKLERF